MDKFSRRALLRISFTVISPTIVACLQSDRKRSFSVQQSRWNIFLRAIASFTPSNLGSVVVIFAGALQRDGSRERERESALVKNFSRYSFEMHSVKVRCERVKRENSGKKKADFPLSFSLWRVETTS